VSRRWLPLVLLGIYAAGVLLCVARLFYGWSLASAMIRRARRDGPIRGDLAERVDRSSEVTVPMTVGPIRSVIVLPVTWKTRDTDALAAIIGHTCDGTTRRSASQPISTARSSGSIRWRGGSSGSSQ
jgi:hypothetical protein